VVKDFRSGAAAAGGAASQSIKKTSKSFTKTFFCLFDRADD
jgi:hypothetical protein